MSEDEVKCWVIDVVCVMCYESIEYFWINDLSKLVLCMFMYLIVLEFDG